MQVRTAGEMQRHPDHKVHIKHQSAVDGRSMAHFTSREAERAPSAFPLFKSTIHETVQEEWGSQLRALHVALKGAISKGYCVCEAYRWASVTAA
jgi:hypothetical protein